MSSQWPSVPNTPTAMSFFALDGALMTDPEMTAANYVDEDLFTGARMTQAAAPQKSSIQLWQRLIETVSLKLLM